MMQFLLQILCLIGLAGLVVLIWAIAYGVYKMARSTN